MNEESFWAGYCDGAAGFSFSQEDFDRESYKKGYDIGIKEKVSPVLDELIFSSLIEEYD